MKDTILLFDNYGTDSQNLHTSFQLAGLSFPAVVIEDNGFLPENVISVYGSFLGDYKEALGEKARPKYFNQIKVPAYWEISGNNSSGSVHDLSRERAKIFYAEPAHKRRVRVVDWYDEKGVVRASDHYNRYGAVFARTVFNAKGQKFSRSYFSVKGEEVIVENFATGDIILNDDGKVRIFHTKTEFIVYFLEREGYAQGRIFFNSLSTPFFVSNRLTAKAKEDILFWQEPVRQDIPGNMQVIFQGQAGRTETVMVQKRQSYDKLIALGANPDMTHKLGFLYSFAKENRHEPKALICTNSDNIEQCETIVKALPEMHFSIAALTEMSPKLMNMDNYENVSLYPGVKQAVLDGLFEECDFYLDINHEGEIVSAVSRAFQHNQLIFAFEETAHNRDYVAEAHIYPANDVGRMIADVKKAVKDGEVLDRRLRKQQEAAMAETAERYRGIGVKVRGFGRVGVPEMIAWEGTR
ncbi:MAG: accessory Sec system glycosylation chaperone GtfB [Ruminococcus flavefaciens]|nr:accessory Sec system glycosylation chaperone GtfB [Ruminococcus flavefaciens]